ncbi:MAG: hypothetical protein M1833_003527 [Piccolia ochrophora]|nr:MAG: hypothetical protein M1833_003527 [Piccolia ochrophora]
MASLLPLNQARWKVPSVPRRYLVILVTISVILFLVFQHHSTFSHLREDHWGIKAKPTRPLFAPGTVKPSGSQYSQTLVLPRLRSENIDWIARELPNIQTAIYTVDDEGAPLRPPSNKGHEAMVYLTYIIDNYDKLSDTSIFVHSHRRAWHNNDLLDGDMVKMVRRLSNERVAREGYFNLRCHPHPGCPNWISLNVTKEDINKKEEVVFPTIWDELYPGQPMPDVLAQPCCGQFAASRARLQSIPLSQWNHFRDWLLKTDLRDALSGRIFEYTWQYMLTGHSSLCVPMNECYCDGYGVCFGSAQKCAAWFDLREDKRKLDVEMHEAREKGQATDKLDHRITDAEREMRRRTEEALTCGDDPRCRAEEMGRPWKEGDGF